MKLKRQRLIGKLYDDLVEEGIDKEIALDFIEGIDEKITELVEQYKGK